VNHPGVIARAVLSQADKISAPRRSHRVVFMLNGANTNGPRSSPPKPTQSTRKDQHIHLSFLLVPLAKDAKGPGRRDPHGLNAMDATLPEAPTRRHNRTATCTQLRKIRAGTRSEAGMTRCNLLKVDIQGDSERASIPYLPASPDRLTSKGLLLKGPGDPKPANGPLREHGRYRDQRQHRRQHQVEEVVAGIQGSKSHS